jgi:hypothetical protein
LGQAPEQQLGPGTWTDPLEAAQTPEERTRIQGMLIGNARARQAGLPIPNPEVEPVFTPAPTEEEIERGQDLADKRRQEEFTLGIEGRRTSQQERTAAAGALLDVPDWAKNRQQLLQKRADIEQMLTGGETDFDDPEQAREVKRKYDYYQRWVGNLRPPDPNESLRVWDGTKFTKPRPGQQPTHFADPSNPAAIPEMLPEVAEEQAEQRAQQQQQQAQQDTYQKDLGAYGKQVLQQMNAMRGDVDDPFDAETAAKDAKAALAAAGILPPVDPSAPPPESITPVTPGGPPVKTPGPTGEAPAATQPEPLSEGQSIFGTPLPRPQTPEAAAELDILTPPEQATEPPELQTARKILAMNQYMGSWSPSALGEVSPSQRKEAEAIVKEWETTGSTKRQKVAAASVAAWEKELPTLSKNKAEADRQYAALPPGTDFIDPEGNRRTKP